MAFGSQLVDPQNENGRNDTELVFARANSTSPCAPTFSDVDAGEYFAQLVTWLYCQGAVSGYSDNTFQPFNNVTRGQLVKILLLAKDTNLDYKTTQDFSDVASTDTFFRYAKTAHDFGWISGYADGMFHPNADVTRGQLSKIITQAMSWQIDTTGGPHFNDVLPTNPFYSFVETAYQHGVISGYADGSFHWEASATRGQVSKIIYQALQTNTPAQKTVK